MSNWNFKEGSLNANGIEIHYAEKGEGPLVIFCHGWPESWYSWRHQLQAIGSADIEPWPCTCGAMAKPRNPLISKRIR